MRPSQWLGNRLLTLTANVLYRSTLSDMETCYKLFDRSVLDGITIESDGFDFEPEITAKVLRAATASTRSRCPTPGASRRRAPSSSGATACARHCHLVRYRLARHI